MNRFLGLIFIFGGRKTASAGKALCKAASTPEERKIAASFKRVYYGTIALCIILVAAIAAVMILNNPFLDSGTKRYGTVQDNGKISYVQGEKRIVSADELGLENFELKNGDKVIIFFDENDNIKSVFPRDFYNNYTENRVLIIIFSATLGISILLIYAFVICRLTSFGRAWYLYCREIKGFEQPKLSKGQKALIYTVASAVTLALLLPQIVYFVKEINRIQEIEEFGKRINSVSEAAEKAGEISDKIDKINDNLSGNSGVDKAKSAAGKMNDIKNKLQSR